MQQGMPHNAQENINRAYFRFERTQLIEIVWKYFENEELPSTYSQRCTPMNCTIEYDLKCSIGNWCNFFTGYNKSVICNVLVTNVF